MGFFMNPNRPSSGGGSGGNADLSIIPSGNITATNVKSAIYELDSLIENLKTLTEAKEDEINEAIANINTVKEQIESINGVKVDDKAPANEKVIWFNT